MSRENVEIVTRAFEAASRRPKPEFATVNALYHPDHELVTPLSRLEGTVYHGAEGFGQWLRLVREDWELSRFRLEEVSELDDERVLIAAAFVAQGKRGGVPIDQRQGLVVTVRDGKIVRTEAYSSTEEALAAVRGESGEPRRDA